MSKSFQFGIHTQVGRSKQVNDNFSGNFQTPNGDLFIVCNGYGGNVGGATASRMTTESIKVFFQHQVYYNLKEALSQSLLFANSQIQTHSLQNPDLEGMSSSVVIVLIKGDDIFYTHVGDCRLYLMRNKAIRKLTRDHTFVQQLINQGAIDEDEAKFHPRKREVNKTIGLLKESEKSNDSDVFRFEKGDVLLLSTQGLHGTLHDYDIELILKIDEAAQNKADELIKALVSAEGDDNATAMVINFTDAKDLLIPVNIPIDGNQIDNNNEVVSESNETIVPDLPNETKINIAANNISATEIPEIKMQSTIQKKAKGLDWALIILCVLFVIVLGLFFSGWDYMTNDPSSNELLNQQPVVEEKSLPQPDANVTGKDPSTIEPVQEKKKTTEIIEKKKEAEKEEKKSIKRDTIILYTVKSGDNISKISEKFNIKKSTIKKLNDLKDDEIKLGQELKIKVKAVHTIGPGDILSKLSKDYDVKKEAIKKANDMTGNKTNRGEKLIIPNP